MSLSMSLDSQTSRTSPQSHHKSGPCPDAVLTASIESVVHRDAMVTSFKYLFDSVTLRVVYSQAETQE